MKKFLIGLMAGVVLTALIGVVLLVALFRLAETRPTVQQGTTLVLNLQGAVPEKAPMEIPLPAFESRTPVTVQELRSILSEAATDSRIEAVALFPRGVGAGWGKMQEIRSGLMRFKESGKPLVAYLRNPGTREYYLASAADKIYLSREDFLDLKGLRIEATYLRQTLDKLGIEVEIEHAGRYKDAGDTFTRSSMSPETREVLDSVLDELYSHLIETVAGARGLAIEEVRASMDEGPFLAVQAVEHGLVDGLLYEDELFEKLRSDLAQAEIRKLSHRAYLRAISSSAPSPHESRIALVIGSGTIVSGSGADGFDEEGLIGSRDFTRVLRQVRRDDQVKGVILRIDSPGGDAIASDEILREVRLLRDAKPMVISMSDVAASGGYYIAMTGDPIIAYPNTLTGSIGVIYGKANLRGFYDKIGLQKEILTRGRFADIDSDYRPLTDAGRKKLREGIDSVYDGFLNRVADARKRERSEIETVAEGRVWLGSQARRNGLVDELGGLDLAVKLIKGKAGIAEAEEISLVPYPPKRSFWEYLMDQNGDSLLGTTVRNLIGGSNLQVLREGGILRLMPYEIEVR